MKLTKMVLKMYSQIWALQMIFIEWEAQKWIKNESQKKSLQEYITKMILMKLIHQNDSQLLFIEMKWMT